MPTARESLLDAAHAAVYARPWAGVRMIEVAERAGVSRQTLYNEFGSKDRLGSALVGHRIERFLQAAAGAGTQAARRGTDPAGCCAAAVAWMLRTMPGEPLVRAALTGCWGCRMPLSAEGRPREPGELATELCDRLVAGLAAGGEAGDPDALWPACETGLRLALSFVVAPVGDGGDGQEEFVCGRVQEVVRALLR